MILFQDGAEIRIQHEIGQPGIAVKRLLDFAEESCADNTAAAPHEGDISEFQFPFVFFGRSTHHCVTLGVRTYRGGIECLPDGLNKGVFVAPEFSGRAAEYFGGGDPGYYLGDKVEYFSWEKPQKGWVAVSATLLQGGRGNPAPGFNQPTGHFNWLDQYAPVTKIGYSIFIYHIE